MWHRPQRSLVKGAAVRRLVAVRHSGSSIFGGLFGSNSKPASPELEEMLTAATRGRMDRAFALAKPLAAEEDAGRSPVEYLAQECSRRAASSFADSAAGRQRAIELAISGASFRIPGRGKARPAEIAEGFWLREVSDQHERADAILKLARASVALRGLEPVEAVEALQAKSSAGDAAAVVEAAAVARDFQLVGKVVVVRLLTGRSLSVLSEYIRRTMTEDPAGIGRCPVLFNLIIKLGKHFREALGGTDPVGPLEEPDGRHDLLLLRQYAEGRRAAAERHMQIMAEITSEAATSLHPDPEDGLKLLEVAEMFFQAECPVAERRKALKIFSATAERLKLRES